MRKVMFFINLFALCSLGFGQTITKTSGKKYSQPLTDKNDVIAILFNGDTDGRLEPGMTRQHWGDDIAAVFNKFVTPDDASDKILSNEDLKKRLEDCQVIDASWTGDREQSEVYSTGWQDNNVFPFPRAPYPGEKVLAYKGYVFLSLSCGNPLQDKRIIQINSVTTQANGTSGGVTVNNYNYINVNPSDVTIGDMQGGNVSESGNSLGGTGGGQQPTVIYQPLNQPLQNQNTTTTTDNSNGGCTNCDVVGAVDYWGKKNWQASTATAIGTWLNFGVNTFSAIWGATHSGGNNYYNYYGNGVNPTNPGGFVPNGTGQMSNQSGFNANGTGVWP